MADLMRPLAKHIFFPLFARRNRSSVPRHLAELERSQFFSPEKIADLRMERLKKLLNHAYANCPFYRERFDAASFDPNRLQSPDDLLRLPVLTKKDIQGNLDRLTAQNLPESELVPDRTGGSTGHPLHYFIDRERIFSRNAGAIRHDRWTGWDIGQKSAYLWGHPGDMSSLTRFKARVRNLLLDRQLILDTTAITADRMEQFRLRLLRYNPTIYVGYANACYLYARFLQKTGADYHRPTAIITSAEMLDPDRRKVIEEVFGCRVFDRYGCRETSIIASECDHHTGLHVCAETIHVEILADNKPAAPGQLGKIVVTDLLNYGMPFIRYQIEDVGKPSQRQSCPCGRGLPLIDMAAGRFTDFLVTPDGRIISGPAVLVPLITRIPGVAQIQLIQETRDELTLRIVKSERFSDESLRFLDREIPKYFGQVKCAYEFVESIPTEASGKYRFSISKLDISEMF